MRRFVEVMLAAGLSFPACTSAQTIADYSRAQRAALEATMSKNLARPPAGTPVMSLPTMPSLPPLPSAPFPGAPSAANASPSVPPSGEADGPILNGIVAFPDRRVAEFSGGGAAYVLSVGEEVPGTPWRIRDVERDRVVMTHRRAGRDGRAVSTRTVFLGAGVGR